MDLVLKSFQKNSLIDFARTFSIPIGIMVLIAMMVIPLNPWQLDILFTTNLLVSLLVLMVALQTFKPLLRRQVFVRGSLMKILHRLGVPRSDKNRRVLYR